MRHLWALPRFPWVRPVPVHATRESRARAPRSADQESNGTSQERRTERALPAPRTRAPVPGRGDLGARGQRSRAPVRPENSPPGAGAPSRSSLRGLRGRQRPSTPLAPAGERCARSAGTRSPRSSARFQGKAPSPRLSSATGSSSAATATRRGEERHGRPRRAPETPQPRPRSAGGGAAGPSTAPEGDGRRPRTRSPPAPRRRSEVLKLMNVTHVLNMAPKVSNLYSQSFTYHTASTSVPPLAECVGVIQAVRCAPRPPRPPVPPAPPRARPPATPGPRRPRAAATPGAGYWCTA